MYQNENLHKYIQSNWTMENISQKQTKQFSSKMNLLAAGAVEQIQSSVLLFLFSFLFLLFSLLFSNLYPYCQFRVSFGYLDFLGTSPQGTLYPLGHFTLWGPLTLGAFCPQGHFALHDLLLFESFRLFGNFGFFSYCRQLGLKGLQSCCNIFLKIPLKT